MHCRVYSPQLNASFGAQLLPRAETSIVPEVRPFTGGVIEAWNSPCESARTVTLWTSWYDCVWKLTSSPGAKPFPRMMASSKDGDSRTASRLQLFSVSTIGVGTNEKKIFDFPSSEMSAWR